MENAQEEFVPIPITILTPASANKRSRDRSESVSAPASATIPKISKPSHSRQNDYPTDEFQIDLVGDVVLRVSALPRLQKHSKKKYKFRLSYEKYYVGESNAQQQQSLSIHHLYWLIRHNYKEPLVFVEKLKKNKDFFKGRLLKLEHVDNRGTKLEIEKNVFPEFVEYLLIAVKLIEMAGQLHMLSDETINDFVKFTIVNFWLTGRLTSEYINFAKRIDVIAKNEHFMHLSKTMESQDRQTEWCGDVYDQGGIVNEPMKGKRIQYTDEELSNWHKWYKTNTYQSKNINCMKFNELRWALTEFKDTNEFVQKIHRRVDAFVQLLRSSHPTEENYVYNIALAIWRVQQSFVNVEKENFESLTKNYMTKFIVFHVALKNLTERTKRMLNQCEVINENDAYRRLSGQSLLNVDPSEPPANPKLFQNKPVTDCSINEPNAINSGQAILPNLNCHVSAENTTWFVYQHYQPKAGEDALRKIEFDDCMKYVIAQYKNESRADETLALVKVIQKFDEDYATELIQHVKETYDVEFVNFKPGRNQKDRKKNEECWKQQFPRVGCYNFTGPISFVNSNQTFKHMLTFLEQEKYTVLGFDTEDLHFTNYSPLIQIACKEHVFLIDNLIKYPDNQRSKFDEMLKGKIKLACGLENEVNVLKSFCMNFENGGWIDLQHLHAIIDESYVSPEKISLQNLCKNYLNLDMDKSVTNSVWLRRPLTEAQQAYAANDAAALIEIFNAMRCEYGETSFDQLIRTKFPIE